MALPFEHRRPPSAPLAAIGAAPGQTVDRRLDDRASSTSMRASRVSTLSRRRATPARVRDRGRYAATSPPTATSSRASPRRRGVTRARGSRSTRRGGVTAAALDGASAARRAVVLSLSHVAYRSSYLARHARHHPHRPRRRRAHRLGPLPLGGLRAGARLDAWELRHGRRLHVQVPERRAGLPRLRVCAPRAFRTRLAQPIQGWMGTVDVVRDGSRYVPAREGIRRFLSGTPPIVGMLAMQDTLALIEEVVGPRAIRAKSIAADGVRRARRRRGARPARRLGWRRRATPTPRGGHVTLGHPAMRAVTARLWAARTSSPTTATPAACASGCPRSRPRSPRRSPASGRSRPRSAPSPEPGVLCGRCAPRPQRGRSHRFWRLARKS